MKTNIFKVKEKKEKRIIIEEEKTKNPFLLFLKRHKNFILTSLILFGICLILISIGLAFSVFQTTSEFDISFLEGDEELITNPDPGIKDEDVAEELLGEVAREEGIVILTKKVLDENNNVIYYFSDKTSIIIQADGKIYRVSSNKSKNYGINENGKIDSTSKKILVKSTTSTLKDGTIITYYTDGSALVEHNGITTFIRDSNNIKINAGASLTNLAPSGVAINSKITKKDALSMVTYTDNTKLITKNNNKILVNSKSQVTETDTTINYDANNSFEKISEKKLKDGNIITYFENGSAIITDNTGSILYVKKSGDIVIKKNQIYEIITNEYGYSKKTINCSNGQKVTYFDNGAAIIKATDGTKKYIEDSDEILYDSNKNITSNPVSSEEISRKKTTDGYDVVNFDNGKSQVIKPDGSSFIIDTDKLIFDTSGNITDPEYEEEEPEEENKEEEEEEKPDPLEGMYVSDAEHTHNETKSNQNSTFIIRNDNTRRKKFRIVIEEVDDYSKYNSFKLPPQYVKFQATIGDNYVAAQKLTHEKWTDENGKINYVVYDGTINAKTTLEVAIALYVDYAELNNSHQNKSFIGTIKVYVNE